MTVLRDEWEETSFRLELHQTNHECARQEQQGIRMRKHPKWNLTFDPESIHVRSLGKKIKKKLTKEPKEMKSASND